MNQPQDETHLQPYRDAVSRFGPGFKATLWGSREAQHVRFDVMIDMVNFDQCTILDIGCGPGDFAQHLIDRKIAFARFIGIDAVPEVIEQAQARQLPDCEFHVSNVLADAAALTSYNADYAAISGTLNTMDDAMARSLITAALDASAQGVIYNFLSDRADAAWLEKDLGPARRFDTLNWLDWSLTQSPRVQFSQAYMDGHDATILIRH